MTNPAANTAMNPDFGKTASDYARHRLGFPDRLFDLLEDLGVTMAGARAADLGTGTGALARGLARRDARVTGIDPAVTLMAEAAKLDMEWGVEIKYLQGKAEDTGLESGAFDLVTSGQSWWWFDADKALAEAARLLKHGGALAICSFSWLAAPGNVAELTEKLIEKHNPKWDMGGGNGLHPEFDADLLRGGFTGVQSAHFAVDAPYTKESWRGRIRASAGISASLTPEQVAAFDEELKAALDAFTGSDQLPVPHGVYAAVGRKLG
jgi:SAM-dependent methyltransferase